MVYDFLFFIFPLWLRFLCSTILCLSLNFDFEFYHYYFIYLFILHFCTLTHNEETLGGI